jgi:hypothetical protein
MHKLSRHADEIVDGLYLWTGSVSFGLVAMTRLMA